ncbi:MAG: hypothetical protein ABR915_21055 [Thermoguttaceae bacterium]
MPNIQPKAKVEPELAPKPAPKPPVKVEPKHETKPRPKENPKPAKKPASLSGLAASVDLPIIASRDPQAATQPVSFGKIEADPSAAFEVKLLGGETAAKGSPRFDLRPAADGEAPGWYVSSGPKDEATKIARVWRDVSEMKFQWLDDAADRNDNYLRNCGLSFSCDGQNHVTALSKPVKAPPLVIDLKKGTAEVRLSREYPPDFSQVRLKILVLDKAFPAHALKIDEGSGRNPRPHGGKGKGTAAGGAGDTLTGRGAVMIRLTKEKAPPAGLRIRFDMRPPHLVLHMDAVCQVAGQGGPLNDTRLRSLEAQVQTMEAAAQAMKTKSKTSLPHGTDDNIKAFKEGVAALQGLTNDINQKKIDYRIFVPLTRPEETPQYDLVLFQTTDESEAEPKKHLKK